MGNQMTGEQENEDSESNSSQQDADHDTASRDIPLSNDSSRSHRSNKHLHVRLVPLSGSPNTGASSSLPNRPIPSERSIPSQSNQVYHLSPGQSCTADELTEEEQVKIAQRIGYIQHLPLSTWNESHMTNKKVRECCICMADFEQDEPIRYLPCMHYYHVECIDDWLMRSITCPTCMEPVDSALLLTFGNQGLDDSS